MNTTDGRWYELLLDWHDLYLDRQEDDKLVFNQFLVSYDKGKGKTSNSQVESSDGIANFIVTCRDDEVVPRVSLPRTMVLRSGISLSLRKHKKIITHQTPVVGSEEYICMMVLFYHPHKSKAEIDIGIEELKLIHDAKDRDPLTNGAREELTKLETVRQKLYPEMDNSLYSALFF